MACKAGELPPGPWDVAPPAETSGWGLCVRAGRYIVARIPGRGNFNNRKGVAHLISATPDLLASCEELVAMAETWDRHFREHAEATGWTDSDPDILARARAAVAKAKGGAA